MAAGPQAHTVLPTVILCTTIATVVLISAQHPISIGLWTAPDTVASLPKIVSIPSKSSTRIPQQAVNTAGSFGPDSFVQPKAVLTAETGSKSQLPISVMGIFALAVTTFAGLFISAQRKDSKSYLQPLLMVSVTGTSKMASATEAFDLFTRGDYSILDIRSEMETAEGRIRGANKGAIEIPMFRAKSVYDANLQKKVVETDKNVEWFDQVKKKFAKNTKLIIICSDGRTRTQQALAILEAEGYQSVLGVEGGFASWDEKYDRQLRPRVPPRKSSIVEDLVAWGQWTKPGAPAPTPSTGPKAAPTPTTSVAPAATETSSATSPLVASMPSAIEVSGTEYLNPQFQTATLAAFPAKKVANVQEARVLWKQGDYTILDLRSDMETADGHIRGPNKGAIEIPMFRARAVYNAELRQKVVQVDPEVSWLDQAKKRFQKNAKIIIMCSDGQTRTQQAVQLLTAEGYQNLVTLQGGYNAWDQVFDKKLAVRPLSQQTTRVWQPDPVSWGSWTTNKGPVTKEPATPAKAKAAAPAEAKAATPTEAKAPPESTKSAPAPPAAKFAPSAATADPVVKTSPAPAAKAAKAEPAPASPPPPTKPSPAATKEVPPKKAQEEDDGDAFAYLAGLGVAIALSATAVGYNQVPNPPASRDVETLIESLQPVDQQERLQAASKIVEAAGARVQAVDAAVQAASKAAQSAADKSAELTAAGSSDAGKGASEAVAKAASAVGSKVEAVDAATQKAAKAIETAEQTAEALKASSDPQEIRKLNTALDQALKVLGSQVKAVDQAADEAAKVAQDAAKTVEKNAEVVAASSQASDSGQAEKALESVSNAVNVAAKEITEAASQTAVTAEAASRPTASAAAAADVKTEETVLAVRNALNEVVDIIEDQVEAINAAAKDVGEAVQSAADAVEKSAIVAAKDPQAAQVKQTVIAANDAVAQAADDVDSQVKAVDAAVQKAAEVVKKTAKTIEDNADIVAEKSKADLSPADMEKAMNSVSNAVTEAMEELGEQLKTVNEAAANAVAVSENAAETILQNTQVIVASSPNAAKGEEGMKSASDAVNDANDAIRTEVQAATEVAEQAVKVAQAAEEVLAIAAKLESTTDPAQTEMTVDSLRTSLASLADTLRLLEDLEPKAAGNSLVPIALGISAAAGLGTFAVLRTRKDEWALTPAAAEEMVQNGSTLLIDIRSSDEVEEVPDLVPAARGRTILASVPRLPQAIRQRTSEPEKVEREQFAQTVSQLGLVKGALAVVVMCREGSGSQMFARQLRDKGLPTVYYVKGGFTRWRRDGLAVRQKFSGYGQ